MKCPVSYNIYLFGWKEGGSLKVAASKGDSWIEVAGRRAPGRRWHEGELLDWTGGKRTPKRRWKEGGLPEGG